MLMDTVKVKLVDNKYRKLYGSTFFIHCYLTNYFKLSVL